MHVISSVATNPKEEEDPIFIATLYWSQESISYPSIRGYYNKELLERSAYPKITYPAPVNLEKKRSEMGWVRIVNSNCLSLVRAY